jgi:hypothetical protein
MDRTLPIGDSPLLRDICRVGAGLDAFVKRLALQERNLARLLLFKNLFYGWLLLNTVALIPLHRDIWGPDALFSRPSFHPNSLFSWIFDFLTYPSAQKHYLLAILGQVLVLLFALRGIAPRVMTVAVYVFTMNLDNLCGPTQDGGNNLSHLIMFYMMFMNVSGRPTQGTGLFALLGRALSNASFFTAQLQVAIVYLCGALYKLNGPLWKEGMALYYILQTETFSQPWLYAFVRKFPWFSFFGTYFTMAFQATFPFLVWFRQARPFMLASAFALHLSIAFGMGLMSFGLAMCVMTSLFYTESWSSQIIALFSRTNQTQVAVEEGNARLRRLVLWLKRLDWRGAITVGKFEELSSAAAISCPETRASLVTLEQDGGKSYTNAHALWRLCAKLPLTYVLIPFWCAFGIAYYAGLAQWLFNLWAPASGCNAILPPE